MKEDGLCTLLGTSRVRVVASARSHDDLVLFRDANFFKKLGMVLL